MKHCSILKFFAVVVLMLNIFNVSAESINSNITFDTYTYNLSNNPVSIKAPYVGGTTFTGGDFKTANFLNLQDMCCNEEGTRLYIADSGNNRIVIINDMFHLVGEIDAKENGGMKNPSGICISNRVLYIADSGNSRILCFDSNTGEFLRELPKPQISLLGKDYKYEPTKIAIDNAGRLYVIAKGITNGLLYLEADGSFIGFLGAPEVNANALDMLWRKFMTKEQLEQSAKNIPTEYNSVMMDKKGFLYVTSKSTDIPPISRLNSQGTNVLHSSGEEPAGDAWYKTDEGKESTSIFVDVLPLDNGEYMALDTSKGRIFTYSKNGELLYVFGGIGSQEGTLYSPIAIADFSNRILVADSSNGELVTYNKTEFGELINNALSVHISGDYKSAYSLWDEVLKQCPSYYPASLAKAKLMIQSGENKAAMKYLKGLGETEYYSLAFRAERSIFVRKLFYPIIFLVVGAILIITLWKRYKYKIPLVQRYEATDFCKEYRYVSYCMFHPFDGFWDVKHEKRGSRKTAIIISVMFVLLYGISAQYSGYLVLGYVPDSKSTLLAVIKIVFPLILWCISNWCFTTLMDGKGTFDDIFIVTAYSLKPYIIFSIPMLLLSQCLAGDEVFIYSTLNTILIAWVLVLVFFGMITVHDYSLSKGFLTALLTMVGICLILFIIMVFFNQLQELIDFVQSLIKEFSLRIDLLH